MEDLLEFVNGTTDNGFGQRVDFDSSPNKIHGFRMVVMEMTLAFFGVVFNLMVLISIRERESLLESTVNVVLANLCFANLISAVFVKSIAVIYNGYAVAASLWEVELAFCTIHTVTFRATWAVFPYSIVVICWNGLATRAQHILRARAAAVAAAIAKGDTSKAIARHGFRAATAAASSSAIDSRSVTPTHTDDPHSHMDDASESEEDDDDDEGGGGGSGLNARHKTALGFIWAVSAGYAVLSKEIMSKERFVSCSVRQELTEKMNLLSLVIAIGIPVLIGPVLCPIVHAVLTVCQVCFCLVQPSKHEVDHHHHHHHVHQPPPPPCAACLLDLGLVAAFSVVLLIVYPTHMYVTEMYLATPETHFAFMAFKYCFGCLHLVLLPLAILIIKGDIRRTAVDVYFKRVAAVDAAAAAAGQTGAGVTPDAQH